MPDAVDPESDGGLAGDDHTYHLLSVIVPVFNERSTVAEVIRRIRAVDLPGAGAVVVVAPRAAAGSAKLLAPHRP